MVWRNVNPTGWLSKTRQFTLTLTIHSEDTDPPIHDLREWGGEDIVSGKQFLLP